MGTALYYRLSGADGDLGKDGKDESNSIENQRLLIASFLKTRSDLKGKDAQEYIDDGYTGTNFKRPAFERMMNDVRRGTVDTIIVKDLSRFGRDYIGVGEYLEELFPILHIRFIAVNDRYDSSSLLRSSMGIELVVANLVNSMYSRDAGKKLYSANKVKWEKGLSTTGKLPFGYRPDPMRKGRYALDPEAACIVRRIFDLALLGCNSGNIAQKMNEEGHPIPSEYNRIHKVAGKETSHRLNPDRIWDAGKVRRILRAEEHTGAMIMGKHKKVGGRQRFVPRSEWFITPGANEAIVTDEEFEKAQNVIRRMARKEGFKVNSYPLKGKVRCGHCRCSMQYRYGCNEIVWCKTGAQRLLHSHCSPDKFIYGRIESVVFRELKRHIAQVRKLSARVRARQNRFKKAERTARRKQEWADTKAGPLRVEKMRAYEQYVDGRISFKLYKAEKERLDGEIARLAARAETALPKEVEKDSDFAEAQRLADIFGRARKLTREMADAFILAVYVHDDYRIEIVYRFDRCLTEIQKRLDSLVDKYGQIAG